MPAMQTMADCHSSEHGNSAESQENNAADVPCNCGEADSITAAAVRSETIRQPAAIINDIAEIDLVPAEFALEPYGSNNFSFTQDPYHTFFRYRSGPSRAPPRL